MGQFTKKGHKETTSNVNPLSFTGIYPTGKNRERYFFYNFDHQNTSYPYSIIYTESIPPNMKLGSSLDEERDDLNIKGWINFPKINFKYKNGTGTFYLPNEKDVLLLLLSEDKYNELYKKFNEIYYEQLNIYNTQIELTKDMTQYLTETMNTYKYLRPTNVDQFVYYYNQLKQLIEDDKISFREGAEYKVAFNSMPMQRVIIFKVEIGEKKNLIIFTQFGNLNLDDIKRIKHDDYNPEKSLSSFIYYFLNLDLNEVVKVILG